MGGIFFDLQRMIKYFLSIIVSLLFINQSVAKNINIQENVNLIFKCEFQKKIIKNLEYNYKVFLPKDLDKKDLKKIEVKSKKPATLLIKGLSLFLSETTKLDVKIVNNEIILFKAIDNNLNYSESGIITRKTGELVHEISKNMNSENSEKYITFYSCSKVSEKV